RQGTYVAHRFKQAGNHSVDHGNSDCGCHSRHSSTFSRRQRKGNSKNTHHKGDYRECNLFLELNFQLHNFEAALLQVVNIAAQLLVVHLQRLLHFLFEILRRLGDGGKGGSVISAVVANGRPLERSLPSLRAYPAFQAGVPLSTTCVNTVHEFKGAGFELEDGKITEQVSI